MRNSADGLTSKNLLSPLSKEFELFLSIYRHKSISRASQELGQDQGNASKSLALLEDRLGKKLFVRFRGGVQPTSTAAELYASLSEMKSLWEDAYKGAYSGAQNHTLRIGAHPSLASVYFPALFQYFREEQSQFFLKVSLGRSYELTQKVQDRELDLAIVSNPIKNADLVIRSIATEDIELCGLEPPSEKSSLLINPQMNLIHKLIESTPFRRIIDIESYHVAAEIASQSTEYLCVIPSTLREKYPRLKAITALKKQNDIKLISYLGSPIAKELLAIKKYY